MALMNMFFHDGNNTPGVLFNGDEISNKLKESMRWPIRIWMVLSVIGFVASITESVYSSVIPLFTYDTEQQLREHKERIDWGVGVIIKEANPSAHKRTLNAAFSVLIWTFGQGVIISVGMLFLVFIIYYSFFLSGLKRDYISDAVVCLPSFKGNDKRYGFEVFEEFSKSVFNIGILLFFTFYMVVIQHQFLETSTHDKSILHFLFQPFLALLDGLDGVEEQHVVKLMFDPIFSLDPSTSLSILAGVTVIAVSFGFLFRILSDLASSSKSSVMSLINTDWVPPYAYEQQRVDAIGETMVTWPSQWININKLTILLVFGLAGLVFYRIFPFLFLYYLLQIVYAIMKEMRGAA